MASGPIAPGTARNSDSFYKGRSQEKTHLLWLEFFLLRSRLDRARCVLTYRAMCSAAGHVAQRFGFPRLAVFHRFFVTKPVRSETSKAETVVNLATIVLLGTRGPSLFLVIREGLRSRARLGCPKHAAPFVLQMLGVEAHSPLPHDQNDGGNLPGQGQTCHFGPHALGQQSCEELLQRTRFA
jgi:hypothetical protein